LSSRRHLYCLLDMSGVRHELARFATRSGTGRHAADVGLVGCGQQHTFGGALATGGELVQQDPA
jgi:hypothetical protein